MEDLTERGPVPVRVPCAVPGCTNEHPTRALVCARHWRRLSVPARRFLMGNHGAAPGLVGVAVLAFRLPRERVPAQEVRVALAALSPSLARAARNALAQIIPA